MKVPVHIARFLVGLLFIFSGLVKANDPLGLSYKMQEFFELWGMTRFNGWTLTLSVLMNAFEIIAGMALLLGWRIRLFSWLLLALILFFTFLTGYAFLSGKFRSCGCFGDCLPIDARSSFVKDLILLGLIGLLFQKQEHIRALGQPRTRNVTMLVTALIAFGLQWYALTFLPLKDCLPFRKGNNIPTLMRIPEGARPDSFAIRFIYKKDGKEYEFSPLELPADLATYIFVSRQDKLIRRGNAEPTIKGFSLTGSTNIDSTNEVLALPAAVLLFAENFEKPSSRWERSFADLVSTAAAKRVPVYLVTAQPDQAREKVTSGSFPAIPVFRCDNTAIRTAARTNPCLLVLENGTIRGKYSRYGFGRARRQLERLRTASTP